MKEKIVSQGITVSFKELKRWIKDVIWPINGTPFIWGRPGCGKTALIQELACEMKIPLLHLYPATYESTDIGGIFTVISEGDKKYVERLPPRTFFRYDDYILFLDEYQACPPDVAVVFNQVIYDRRIEQNPLPEKVKVVAASNRATDQAFFNPIKKPTATRVYQFTLETTNDEWLEWGIKNNLHPVVITYIEHKPDHLFFGEFLETSERKTKEANPRTWDMLSRLLHQAETSKMEVTMSAISTVLPDELVPEFMEFYSHYARLRNIGEILEGKECPFERKDELYFIINALIEKILAKHREKKSIKKEMDNFGKFLIREVKNKNRFQDLLSYAFIKVVKAGIPYEISEIWIKEWEEVYKDLI